MSLNKLLIISGPTATGKTALAVEVSKLIPAELVSADSRQIYKGLDIGVGKDHPIGTPIHLIDIIAPDEIFSVTEFKKLTLAAIKKIQSQNKLPILVGCSGFYINAIINNSYSTFDIKPNKFLRFFLNKFSTKYLKITYKLLDKDNFFKLNNSDINNPRRLIRKIEIKLSKKSPLSKGDLEGFNILHLSLTAPNSYLYPRIDARVDERLKMGHLDELKNLLKKYSWSDPGLKVSAYQVFKSYFKVGASLAEAQKKWKFLEHGDARHQKTYFKKLTPVSFVNITGANFSQITLDLVKKWYNKP